MEESSLKLPIESIELGYFTLNPMTEQSKDIIYDVLILNHVQSNKYLNVFDIKKAFNEINIPSYKADGLMKKLLDDGKLMEENNKLLISVKGNNYISDLKTDIITLLDNIKNLFKNNDLNDNEINLAFKLMDFLANRDSELISHLLGVKENYSLKNSEKMEINKIIPSSLLKDKLINIINTNIANNEEFKNLFTYLIYGHIAEYLLLSSSNEDLMKIFGDLKQQTNEIKILLDTNSIITLVCHYDTNNIIMNHILKYITEQNAGIRFVYDESTMKELDTTLESFRGLANQIQNQDEKTVQKIIDDSMYRTPLRSFYYEDKYRDWDHYIYLFKEAWKNYINIYPIESIGEYYNDLSDLKNIAEKFSGYFIDEEKTDKKLKILEHDIFIILIANKLAETFEKDGFIKKILVLTFDTKFEMLEREIMYLNSGHTLRSINMRQLIAYLSPIFSLNQFDLKFETKILYGSLLNQQKTVQHLIKNVLKSESELGFTRTPFIDSNYEKINAKSNLSKEVIFSGLQIKLNEE